MLKRTQKGFTLVELSIVIVIIGLIVAGVTAGQSLVKQAQLRSVITEQEGIRVAVNAFRLQYNALPGDFNNGSSYWSSCGVSAAACNGDGNKQILMSATTTIGESYIAWLHLSLAGLYSGSFVPTDTSVVGAIGGNIPASKFSGAGITLMYDLTGAAATAATAGDNGTAGRKSAKNVILFGGVTAGIANGTIFSVNQAYSVDTKVDDGNPEKGTVLGAGVSAAIVTAGCIFWGANGADESGIAYIDDVYNYGSTDVAPCAIAFTL
jgi:prepilin-type N-terminal cleavage/methylation domain-containing protein